MKISDLEKLLKIEAGSLKTAIEKDEIQLPDYVIRTKEEETTLQANIENQKKERYEAGLEVGTKREVKELADKLGYNLEGKAKTVENLISFHTESLEKKAKKPITELETDFKKLQENYITLEKNHNEFKSQVENEKNLTSFRTELAKGIPANVELMFNPERIISFAEKEVGFKVDNGVRYITKNGEVAKDPKTLQPITPDIFMSEYIKDFVKKTSGGAGEKDNVKSNNVGSFEAYEKTLVEQGINPASEKGAKMIREAQKQGLIKF